MDLIHAIFEPAGDGPHPAILAMHGWGSSALDLLGLAPYVADGRCLMLCPQGPVEVAIGAVNGYGWYQLRMGAPPDLEAMGAAAERLIRFVEAAVERYPIDRRKLVVMGFSQGGVMAYNLALRYPERFAALAALSTWFPQELAEYARNPEALAQMPALVQHGRADDMIDITRARQSVERLRALKLPLAYREYDCGHEITVDGIRDLSRFLLDKVVQPLITL
ncbi:MAG TPA: alpha/beta fold hydrolase [Candidatus Binataceae bacterium]|jgi:phospholipase/carboxylesterase|nr:alpha/beta fold hydrolase [Candidatus Binataceae bacterium]